MSDIAAPRPASGFTIIELLVAITLMGLLTLSLESAMRFAVRNWGAHQTQSALAVGAAPVQTILRNVIEQTHQVIEAQERKLALISVLPQSAMKPGLHRISFEIEDGVLLMIWSDAQGREAPQRAIIARDVSTFAVAYRERGDEAESWQANVKDASRIALIRVSMSLAVARREVSSVFMAAVMAEGAAPEEKRLRRRP
jgi:prepilin-type N-terminal cleavage/methylation domain-containing protein